MAQRKRFANQPSQFYGAAGTTRPDRAPDAGASFLELIIVLGMIGVLTALAASLILQTYAGVQSRLGSSTLFDNGVIAVNQMTREIRTAGYPSAKFFSASMVTASPGIVATPFVTVSPYDLVFQADINGNGTVEQIEYVNPPQSQNLLRNITAINPNGSLATSTLTTLVVGNVQNQLQNQPLFTSDVDPTIPRPFPLNVRTIYINLVLQSAGNAGAPPDAVTLLATCHRMNF